MIAIQINNEFLDLFPDTKFNITEVNPLFDKEGISRFYTLPLKVPPTYKNKMLLKTSARLDSFEKEIQIDAVLFIFRNPYDYGFVKFIGDTEEYIEIRFENKGQELISNLEDINIEEILETISVPFSGSDFLLFEFTTNLQGEYSGNYFMQIDENLYNIYQGTPTPDLTVPQYFVDAINADYPNLASLSIDDELRINIASYPDIDIAFDTLQDLTLIDGSNIATDRLDSFHAHVLSIYNTPVDTHAFPVLKNFGFYGGENESYQRYINYISDGAVLENIPENTETWKHTFVPLVRVPYVFDKIIENTNLESIIGDYYSSDIIQKALIYNNVALDEVTFTDFPSGQQYLNHYKQSYNLNDHVPEMTAKEYLLRILKSFQLYAIVRDKSLFIFKKIDQISRNAINWTDKVAPRYRRQPVEIKGFTIDYDRDEDDLRTRTGNLAPYPIGNGTVDYVMPFDTLGDQLDTAFVPEQHAWLIPMCNQKGTSEASKVGKNEYGFRLLIDRGKQPDSNGNNYHLAQSGSTNYEETLLGPSLELYSDQGLYENNYKGVVELEEKAEVVIPATLNLSDIRKIKAWTNSKRYFFTSHGTVTGIIKQIQFVADERGISEVAVTLKKL